VWLNFNVALFTVNVNAQGKHDVTLNTTVCDIRVERPWIIPYLRTVEGNGHFELLVIRNPSSTVVTWTFPHTSTLVQHLRAQSGLWREKKSDEKGDGEGDGKAGASDADSCVDDDGDHGMATSGSGGDDDGDHGMATSGSGSDDDNSDSEIEYDPDDYSGDESVSFCALVLALVLANCPWSRRTSCPVPLLYPNRITQDP
jgi:hypothetical protein